MKQIKILHITPHLGGGVGSVLLNWLQYETLNCKEKKHLIATLDFANEKAKDTVNNTQSAFFTYLFINSPRKNYNIQA